MGKSDLQFMYMVLVLPGLFGLTLVGEGVGKVIHGRVSGWISMVAGVGFLAVIVAAYLVFGEEL